jgi:sugar phosphate isomerase/epimerase
VDARRQGLGREAELNALYFAPTSLVDSPPLELVRAAAAAGYDGVGLRLNASPGLPFHPVLGDAALVRALRDALRESGLAVLDLYSFYLQPGTDVRAFAPALELGASLGARYALTMGDDPEWTRVVDNFGRFCDLAAGFGLACALEFAVMRPLASLGQSARLARESGRRNAVICVDPLNFVRGGGVPAEIAALEPRLFPYAQISDGVLGPGEPDLARLGRMGPNQRRLLGEGVVPLAALLDALPPGLPLSVELPPPPGARPAAAEWAKTTAANVRGFLARYAQAGARA